MRRLDLTQNHQARGKSLLDGIMTLARSERLRNQLSQQQVADKAGISLSTVSKYERGLYPTRVVWLAALVDALGFDLVIVPKRSH